MPRVHQHGALCPFKRGLIVGLVSLGLAACTAESPGEQVHIVIADDAPFHVHAMERSFVVTVQANAKAKPVLHYHWQDFTGKALSEDAPLRADDTTREITSPSGKAGYYGLVFTAPADIALPDRRPGEAREYGFVVLPPPLKNERAGSRFGVVHANPADPYIPPWVKTATWETVSPGDWRGLIQSGRQQGKVELPIIIGNAWASDDAHPVSQEQLDELEKRAKAYFAADPDVDYWEAGIEENLDENYAQKFYWDNLHKKMRHLHAAAQDTNKNIKFIYQIASTETEDIKKFLQSSAVDDVDILSVHPYAWPNFHSPDLWLDDLLQKIKQLKIKRHASLPLWFTEVGAPHFGNVPGGFFGYPEENKPTGGLSRQDAAAYNVKMCVIALYNGVEKIFWYNYRDEKPDRDQAEAHFGLRDYWGYPKPVYAAYYNVTQNLQGTKAAAFRVLRSGVRLYEFGGEQQRVFVLWAPPGQQAKVSLAEIKKDLPETQSIQATDTVGHPLASANGVFQIDDKPVFIKTVVGRRSQD